MNISGIDFMSFTDGVFEQTCDDRWIRFAGFDGR